MDDDSDYDPEFHVPPARECDAIGKYLQIETEFMAVENFYRDATHEKIRNFAVTIIAKYTQHLIGVDPDSYVPYLAMNYFDRYFSRNLLPDAKEDVFNQTRLLAICCLTIAAKMRTKSFSVDQFLKERSVDDISHQQILQTELRILNGLQWRMRPVTPFCYLDYFYFPFKQFGGFKRRCINEIIVQSQGVTLFTCYKPSRIALSSLLAASSIVYADKFKMLETPVEVGACMRELTTLCYKMKIEIHPQSKIGSSSSATELRRSEPISIPPRRSEPIPIPPRRTSAILPWPPEPESDPPQQRPVDSEISEVSESDHSDQLRRAKDKDKSSLDDEMMFHMSMSEGESDKQKQSKGKAAAEETSGDDTPSETETERQKLAAKGNAPVKEASRGDAASETEPKLQKLAAKGKAPVKEPSGDAPSETESELQRRAAKGKAPVEEASGDDTTSSETELELQRLAAKGKAPVEETSEDDVGGLMEIFEETVEAGLIEQTWEAKGKAVVVMEDAVEEVEEDAKVVGTISEIVPASEAPPKGLMNFDLCWPTEMKPPEQPIDPRLLVATPERGPGAAPQNHCCFNP